jgi:hypothetical protein
MLTSRRELLKAGGLAAVTGVAGCATAVQPVVQIPAPASVTVMGAAPAARSNPREKQTFVAQTNDPLGHSIADNMFWNDIMMEHAMFFVMLMPGPELARPRAQAEEFQRLFTRQLELSPAIRPDNVVAFNRSSIDLAKRFSDYKKTMREQQATGKMHSLVWPLFFTHTAREADRFAMRLDLYNRRQIELDRREVVQFWGTTMGEHSAFIAHLLDPEEKALIEKATQMERTFLSPRMQSAPGGEVMTAANQILDFKTAGEKGIYEGKIKSIIPPPLASHVRREAVRFIDELKRTQAG